MTSVHSGFGFKCSECGNILNRKDQRHSCKHFTTSVVKRSTGTYTAKEQLEFQKFQMSRGEYAKPIMKKVVPNVFNQGKGMKHAMPLEPTVQPLLKVHRRKEHDPRQIMEMGKTDP